MRPVGLCTFNVRGFPPMRPRHVAHDYLLVRGRAHLWFHQEQWWPRYRRALRKILGKRVAHCLAGGLAGTGISWDTRRFKRRWRFNHPLHGAVPFVCARRKFTGAVLIERATGREVCAFSAHPTPSAFSHRLDAQPARKAAALDAWHVGMGRVRDFIEHHVAMGRLVVVGIDANANHGHVRAALGHTIGGLPVQIVTSNATGIDHLIIVGGTIGDVHTLAGQHSDHAPLLAEWRPQ